MKWIGVFLLGILVLYLGIQGIMCVSAVKRAERRLESYNAKTVQLSNGNMTYVDHGIGDPVLVIHGISGGYDQGYNAAIGCFNDKRIIAPSRFGYLGSEAPDDPSPKEQAKSFAELLDFLEIDQVHVLATSAGGTSAIRFALDFPERTKGLILLSSAPPLTQKTEQYSKYQGPPAILCNNYAMWLISPFFELTMGVESSLIEEMLPMNDRKTGIRIDATISNPDMARNYDQYPIEKLEVKTIILHAKDDKLASYMNMKNASSRFPNSKFISFESGGHKIRGHSKEIIDALAAFTQD